MTKVRDWPFVIVFAAEHVAVLSLDDETLMLVQPVTATPLICRDAVKLGVFVPPVWYVNELMVPLFA